MSCGLSDEICNCHFNFDRISYAFRDTCPDSNAQLHVAYTHHEYEDDLNNNKYDSRVDFYYHLENVLLNKIGFDDEMLNIGPMRISVEKSNEKIVRRLFDLVRKNLALSASRKAQLVKALLCWQCQFDDLKLIEKILSFAKEYFGDAVELRANLGDYETSTKQSNTLCYSIRSGSLDLLQLMVEHCGTRLVYQTQNSCGNFLFNPLSCAIVENHLHILEYLLAKIYRTSKRTRLFFYWPNKKKTQKKKQKKRRFIDLFFLSNIYYALKTPPRLVN